MIKQFILLVLLSLAAIFFRIELTHVLDRLVYIHNYIVRTLYLIFSDDPANRLIKNIISLLIIPVVAGFFVATAFWLIKRTPMPHIMTFIWVLWLILLTTMVWRKRICRQRPRKPLDKCQLWRWIDERIP